MDKALAWAGFVIGLAALGLQFAITVPASLEAGRSLLGSIEFYFSFFTILTNIALVLVYASRLFRTKALAPFSTPLARATAAATITLVMTFYHVMLRPLWQPEGLLLVCDIALHYVTPSLYMAWFIVFNRSGTLSLRALPAMLAAPFAYLVYILIRGAIIGEYPYPVFEVDRIGYPQLAINVLVLIGILSLLGALAIAIDRFRPTASDPKGHQ